MPANVQLHIKQDVHRAVTKCCAVQLYDVEAKGGPSEPGHPELVAKRRAGRSLADEEALRAAKQLRPEGANEGARRVGRSTSAGTLGAAVASATRAGAAAVATTGAVNTGAGGAAGDGLEEVLHELLGDEPM